MKIRRGREGEERKRKAGTGEGGNRKRTAESPVDVLDEIAKWIEIVDGCLQAKESDVEVSKSRALEARDLSKKKRSATCRRLPTPLYCAL